MATKINQPRENRIGNKYHDWTILTFLEGKRSSGKVKGISKTQVRWFYLCRCVCGSSHRVCWSDIQSNKSKRCIQCNINTNILNSQLGVSRNGSSNSNYKGTKDIPSSYFHQLKLGAKTRDLIFRLSLQDLQHIWDAQKGLCKLTGLPLTFESTQETNSVHDISLKASLDRINSTDGYVLGNVAWVSKTVNLCKQQLTLEAFINLSKLISEYNKRICNHWSGTIS